MGKNKFNFLVVGFILLIIGYVVFKTFNIYFYNVNSVMYDSYSKFSKGLVIKDTVSIKTQKLDKEKYLSFNNIKIRNDFKKYTKLKQTEEDYNLIKYVLYDDNGKVKASFWMGETKTYLDMFKSNSKEYGLNDIRFKTINKNYFLEENNISDDLDLVKYIIKHKNSKKNIFTSVHDIKKDYMIKYFAASNLPSLESITEVTGDYRGFIFNSSNDLKEVSILKNNKRYFFIFIKLDYFSDNYIKELLNTVIIN